MRLLSIIRNYFQGNTSIEKIANSECPNCWGRQEYGGELYDPIHNRKGHGKDAETKKGWIQAYVDKFLAATSPRDSEEILCATCKVTYHRSNK